MTGSARRKTITRKPPERRVSLLSRPWVLALGLLAFVSIFWFTRQAIEARHLKIGISYLAEEKMALLDDLKVLQVEVAALESLARIEKQVQTLALPIGPASAPPVVLHDDGIWTARVDSQAIPVERDRS